jgi:hypothetical protein
MPAGATRLACGRRCGSQLLLTRELTMSNSPALLRAHAGRRHIRVSNKASLGVLLSPVSTNLSVPNSELSRCREWRNLPPKHCVLAACMLPMRPNVEWLIAALPREEAELARTRLDQLGRACACGLRVDRVTASDNHFGRCFFGSGVLGVSASMAMACRSLSLTTRSCCSLTLQM